MPKKFSVGTGFIVTSDNQRSSQQDIVLFDEQLNAPLSLVGDIGVFPVESVYGTIEVKSDLNRDTLEQAAQSIGQVRSFKSSKYYTLSTVVAEEGYIRSLPTRQIVTIPLAPRSYIFAFRTRWTIETLQNALHDASRKYGAFFHGVVVLDENWFVYQLATKKGGDLRFSAKRRAAVNEFALKLSKDTIRYPMFAGNMELYLKLENEDA